MKATYSSRASVTDGSYQQMKTIAASYLSERGITKSEPALRAASRIINQQVSRGMDVISGKGYSNVLKALEGSDSESSFKKLADTMEGLDGTKSAPELQQTLAIKVRELMSGDSLEETKKEMQIHLFFCRTFLSTRNGLKYLSCWSYIYLRDP